MTDKYILDDDHNPVPCDDPLEWGQWFKAAGRHVACDNFSDMARVTTIFLGVDHNYSRIARPVLFETMIFWDGHKLDRWQRRCSTWAEAVQMHLHARGLVVEAAANAGRIRVH